MRIALVAVAGMVLGVGGGAAVSALKVKGEILEARAQAAADSAAAASHETGAEGHGDDGSVSVILPIEEPAADSQAVAQADAVPGHEEVGDSTTALDTATTAPDDDSPAEAAPDADPETITPVASGNSDVASGPADGPAGEGAGAAPVALNPDGARKLAKIFGAMKPADAAAVLAEMTDEEVKAVLLQMNDRQAAPILENLPADRAATLSSEVLRDRGGA